MEPCQFFNVNVRPVPVLAPDGSLQNGHNSKDREIMKSSYSSSRENTFYENSNNSNNPNPAASAPQTKTHTAKAKVTLTTILVMLFSIVIGPHVLLFPSVSASASIASSPLASADLPTNWNYVYSSPQNSNHNSKSMRNSLSNFHKNLSDIINEERGGNSNSNGDGGGNGHGHGNGGSNGAKGSMRTLALASRLRASGPSTVSPGPGPGPVLGGGGGGGNSGAAALLNLLNSDGSEHNLILGRTCDFENPCEWKWGEVTPTQSANPLDGGGGGKFGTIKRRHRPEFSVTTGGHVMETIEQFKTSGPLSDSHNRTDGHFLLLTFNEIGNQSTVYHVTSPWFSYTEETCYLEVKFHMHNMQDGSIKMLLTTQNHTVWQPMTRVGNQKNIWEKIMQRIGKYRQPIQFTLEITPSSKVPAHIAIDDIRLVDCFTDLNGTSPNRSCSTKEFRCSNNLCIERTKVCDFYNDCPYGEDEKQNCDRMPLNTTCTFEKGWCGWTNRSESLIHWEIRNKPSNTIQTGPTYDHTYQNSSGHFLHISMNYIQAKFNDRGTVQSSLYAPPPNYTQNTSSDYYNSCQLRFSYHMYGPHMGALTAEIHEKSPRGHRQLLIWRQYGDQGNMWHSISRPLPKLNYLYYIVFTASRGQRFRGDMALDDISLSPECVGQGVPPTELRGYNYEALRIKLLNEQNCTEDRMDPRNITKYKFTTCNNTGRYGPTQEQCNLDYENTNLNTSVKIMPDSSTQLSSGIQVWTVPKSQHYSLIAKGASGGRGVERNQITSHGSIVKTTLYLRQGEKLYILVGQEGASVCDQQNGTLPEKIKAACGNVAANTTSLSRIIRSQKINRNFYSDILRMNNLLGGGGGGGGATFVWKMDGQKKILLLAAGGGGGLAYNASSSIIPYGSGFNSSLDPQSGATQPNGAGGGGGWRGPIVRVNLDGLQVISRRYGTQKEKDRGDENETMWVSAGFSVQDAGGYGGLPCVDSTDWGTVGGFGGGGGGCTAGGAGGGYVGGNAHVGLAANGESGFSYIIKGGLYPSLDSMHHDGPGIFVIIPSVEKACGCESHCVILDDFHSITACVCADNKILDDDGVSCAVRESPFPLPYLIGLILFCLVVFAIIGLLCICLYNRYQRQKVAILRRKMLGGPELQLSRLRAQAGPNGVLTEYNPNYEFGGETFSLTDLKDIPRENLQLVKALGQGAFGEVYQGFYKQRAGDSVEMPVAVKTLPELSSNQAEMDFLMEALIMSKFNHPNIVHFIGVCFDKHPRFIILELLAGGDLKTFLRESRPKPEKPSPLTMKDLLSCAVDVAKGCKYLEENHFIHRDIAARNCLLTTKGPGRVVKIADFGMARDIYRADYYKKGGKAMLPVKWMPPEAFLDGIFTSKTDVWSYGVLLWEVLSLGYMPYPGRGNQDVMQLVTNGGRLEPPTNCPAPVYGIMTQCWHHIPEERPNFATLQERVGYCLQDPEVVNCPLPVFQRPPSSERDATLMRPNPDESSCLRIVHGHRCSNAASVMSTEPTSPNSSTADYLVPLTPYSFGSTATAADSQVSSPTQTIAPSLPDLPDSQSTDTLLDDDEEDPDEDTVTSDNVGVGVGVTSAAAAVIYRPTLSKTTGNGQQRILLLSPSDAATSPTAAITAAAAIGAPNTNGIDNGLTLNPSNLKDKRGISTTPSATRLSAKPGPYVNVGMKKDRSDEEIRC